MLFLFNVSEAVSNSSFSILWSWDKETVWKIHTFLLHQGKLVSWKSVQYRNLQGTDLHFFPGPLVFKAFRNIKLVWCKIQHKVSSIVFSLVDSTPSVRLAWLGRATGRNNWMDSPFKLIVLIFKNILDQWWQWKLLRQVSYQLMWYPYSRTEDNCIAECVPHACAVSNSKNSEEVKSLLAWKYTEFHVSSILQKKTFFFLWSGWLLPFCEHLLCIYSSPCLVCSWKAERLWGQVGKLW